MTPAQARALLALIADLYTVANTPDPTPPPPETNHKPAKEAARAAS